MQSILAWIWAPLVLYALSLGLGLLVASVTRFRADSGLVAPLGFGLGLLLTTPLYYVGFRATSACLVLAVAAAAGFVLQRGSVREALRPNASLFAALGAYVLYLAPSALTGHWTWAGYNFTNDPANTMTATWWILHHGFHEPAVRDSTSTYVAKSSIANGYPLGAHLFLGTARPLMGIPFIAGYQTYIAFSAGMAAASMAQICRRVGLSATWAVVAAVAASGAGLLYVYGQLGGIKEVVVVSLLASATGVAAQVAPGRWTRGAAITAVVPLAATVPVYSAGGIVYSAIFAAAALGFALLDRSRLPLRRLATTAGLAAVVFALLCAPSLAAAVRFGSDVNSSLSLQPLGQLLRPLPIGQIGGIWFGEDWRLPIPPGVRWDVNKLLLALVFSAAVVGAVWALRRRKGPVLLGVLAMLVAILVIGPRTTPYGESKLYIVVSPFIVLTAAMGIWAIASRARLAGVAAGLLIVAGVAYSDAIVYREARLAPTARLVAMEDIAQHARGKGLVLDYEWEEWAKYFFRDARVNSGAEIWWSPKWMPLRSGIPATGGHYDVDEIPINYLTSYSALVRRRAPDASRPPSDFHLAYANKYYELWLRDPRTKVVHHLPINGLWTSQVKVPCSDVRRFARQAAPGDELVAATRPANLVLQPTQLVHSAAWGASPALEGTVVPMTPGFARGRTFVPGGTYRAWMYGSSGRPIEMFVDGRKIGALHEVNTPGGWAQVAQITLRAGQHTLEMRRPGGSLGPGDSYNGRIGPMALEPVNSAGTLLHASPKDVSQLCSRPLDWVEIVRHPGRPA